MTLSINTLRSLLIYEPDTGVLIWRLRSEKWFPNGNRAAAHSAAVWNAKYAGQPALNADKGGGYLHGSILGTLFSAHRVAFALGRGRWPKHEIDHINGNPSDNRLSNLREATRMQNAKNAGAKGNCSGFCGVTRHVRSDRWIARITSDGRNLYLGSFGTPEKAALSYDTAARALHGDFARLNLPWTGGHAETQARLVGMEIIKVKGGTTV